jgi:hypothetical protein
MSSYATDDHERHALLVHAPPLARQHHVDTLIQTQRGQGSIGVIRDTAHQSPRLRNVDGLGKPRVRLPE